MGDEWHEQGASKQAKAGLTTHAFESRHCTRVLGDSSSRAAVRALVRDVKLIQGTSRV